MTIRVGGNIIAGANLSAFKNNNIGEIIQSTIPLTDAGLHLLDGGVISGSGAYSDFVTYMANLYTADPTASYFVQPTSFSTFIRPNISSNGTMGVSDFAVDGRSYSTQQMYLAFDGDSTTYWETYNYAQTDTCYIYNLDAIKISKIKINSKDNKGWTSITISGSNDNITYSEEQTVNTSNTTNTDEFNVVFENFYKYYKIVYTNRYTSSGGYYAQITEFEITATMTGQTPEEVWQQSVTNYGACDKFVYDSVNNTVRLPKRVTDHGVLIKSYSSDTDWYRIYSDGWCEQGGYLANSTSSVKSFTFMKNYNDINYFLECSSVYSSSSATNHEESMNEFVSKTTDGFTKYIWVNSINFWWKACGYIDISDLQQNPVYEYIVIATTTKTDIQVDIDEVMTDLNGKVSIADLTTCHVVVETYVNGTSWYRVYDDGWCEQGGIVNYTSDSLTTVNLLKTYTDTDYCVQITLAIVGSAAINDTLNAQRYSASNVTVSSFQVKGNGTNTYNRQSWFACGYIR